MNERAEDEEVFSMKCKHCGKPTHKTNYCGECSTLVFEGEYDKVKYYSVVYSDDIYYKREDGFMESFHMKKPEFRKWVEQKIREDVKKEVAERRR